MTASRPARSDRLVAWLIAHRVWVLVLTAVLGGVSAWRTVQTYRSIRSDLEELLPRSAPSVAALDVMRDRMDGVRHLGVVVDTGGPSNVDAAHRFLSALAERIRTYPAGLVASVRVDVTREKRFAETYALQLMDPADVAKLRLAAEQRRDWKVTRAMGADLLDADEEPPPAVPVHDLRAKYEQRFGTVRSFPGDRFVSQDGRTAVLLVQAASNATSGDVDRELLERVKADIDSIGLPHGTAGAMRLGFAGDVATRVEEMDGLVADLSLSGALVLLLVVAVVLAFFRSLRSLPLLGIPLALGTFGAFALVALPPLAIRHLNSNTAFLGSIVIGNGINSGIIVLARLREERRNGADLHASIATAVRTTWRPTLAAALAASMAYGSLIATDFRGFNQFGWIGAIGMLLCWGATMLVLPALASLVGWPSVPVGPVSARSASGLPTFVWRHSHAILAVASLASVLAMWGIGARRTDWLEADFSKLRRRDSWQTGERYWGQRMNDTLGQYLTPTVVMADTPEQGAEIEARLRRLQHDGGAGGLIATVRSSRQVLSPSRAESVEQARQLARVLTPSLRAELEPRDQRLVEQALSGASLRPLELADVPPSLLVGMRERSGRVDRNVLVFPKLTNDTWDAAKLSEFAKDVRQAAMLDTVPAQVTGSLLLSNDIVHAMKSDGPVASALALGSVVLVAALTFRSAGLSAAAIGSLLFGVLWMLGAMAWGGQRLNFSNFVALPITFGIGADYAINVLKRYQGDKELDIRRALAATGGAVALCSATTVIGYGSLLVAQNRALFSFGVFAVAGEIACLFAAVVVLPAVLLSRPHPVEIPPESGKGAARA